MTHPATTAIRALRPTQMTLGLREVDRRVALIAALDARKRADYVAARKVPCVRGPGGALYLIDRHHMCRALLAAGIDAVQCEIVCDIDQLEADEFWRFMDLRGWVHPFDRTGVRRPVTQLPASIDALADDPYRALAGEVRRGNGFAKADAPFEEFIWADFLRRRIDPALVQADFAKAGRQALELARSAKARHLPGWRGE